MLGDAQHAPGKRPGAAGDGDVVGRALDAKIAIAGQLLLERVGGERRGQRRATGAAQPQARVVLQIRFGDRDLRSGAGLDDRRNAAQRGRWQLTEPHALELALVVGEEALLPGVVDGGVGGEAEGRLLAGDLHLGARERRLEPVGDAEIVGPEGDRVPAGAGEAQVVVPVDETRGGLPHGRRDGRVGAGPLDAGDLRRRSQPDAVDIQRERRPLQQRPAVEEDVVREARRGVDRHRDAAIGRDEPLDARRQ